MVNDCRPLEMELSMHLAATVAPRLKYDNLCCLSMSTLTSVPPYSQDNSSQLIQAYDVWRASVNCPLYIFGLFLLDHL